MDATTNQNKLKWKAPADPTKFRLHYPPARAPRNTEQWDNWVASMMLDTRFNSGDRVVLARLALHYNLKTGDCFPALRRITIEAGLGESGVRAVQRTIRRAEQLGWIERTVRRGGPAEKNQTNLYELCLPELIIGRRGIGLAVIEQGGAWQVVQVEDGAVVCGPFKSRVSAEDWIECRGPGSETRPPTRQNGGTDTTKAGGRHGNSTAHNREVYNREVTEHSVLSERHRSDFVGPGAFEAQSINLKEGAAEEGAYSEDALSLCEHFFQNFATKPRSFGALRSFCQQNKSDITFGELTALVNAGKVKQSRDGYWMDEPEE